MATEFTVPGSRRRVVVPAHRVFTRHGLRRMGVSERRLASAEFLRVLPGCYVRRDAPASLRAIARTAQRRVVPGAVVCHVTAAELLGLPLPVRLTWDGGAAIHVRVEAGAKRRSAKGLVVHVRAGRPTIPHGGLVLDWPVDVLLDLAGLLPHDDLVACVDALASRRREDLRLPVETIRAEALALRGPGVRALRAAARDARDWVDSPQETRSRLLLQRAGYEEPVTNHRIVDPVTSREYFLDLAYPERMIAIEYDGAQHFTPEQARADHGKDAVLHREGWTVLRIVASDLRDPAPFLALLDDALGGTNPR
ncbi:endonuclease domain-containing protein [Brachybacterium sp. AOP43-C2-M15]|uniref:endonuclease domain-containing protein n=1 Tax=Brachybacterium sp. AOP43-C2-M15 TaxID=3457661 RepID=UPI004033FFB9